MKVGDYIRTKKGILKIRDDKPFKDDKNKLNYLTYGNYTCVLKENIIKSSSNIIDLIEVGDVIRYEIETPLETSGILKGVADVTDEEMLENLKKDKAFHVKSIVTCEQFSQMEYKVGE